MQTNPFGQICSSLLGSASVPVLCVQQPKAQGRTASIRAVLRQAGRPMSAAEILFDAGDDLPYTANSSLVSMLLKWDIQQGRVTFEDGRYCWSSETEADEAEAVREALKLLRRRGYVCTQLVA
jgi:hypothetical protein